MHYDEAMKFLQISLLTLCCTATLKAGLTQEALPSLQALIGPTESEQRWLKIPWETDLAAAREKAQTTGRPIFLWEMDGHPLGCT